MRNAVLVPAQLLLACELSTSTKLLWLLSRLDTNGRPVGPAQIETDSGLSRPTVLKGLAQLAGHRWTVSGPVDRGPQIAEIPAGLLKDRGVSPHAKLLYGHLQFLPTFTHPRGQFTFAQLSGATGASAHTVRRAVRELCHTGWLETAQEKRKDPVHFRLCHPGDAERSRVQERLEGVKFLGERLMREYLSVLIDSTNFQDNATPGFMVNPFTDEHLQLDRYYSEHKVGFEFNGPQHYNPTDLFPEETVARQQRRDLIKEALCHRAGVTLIIVHPQDLSLKTVHDKLPAQLPRKELTGHEPLVDLLTAESDRYRRIARSHGWPMQQVT